MQRGFSLIETILYIGIIALVLGALVQFALTMSESGDTTTAQQEVQANQRIVVQRMTDVIREALGIVTSSSQFDVEDGRLVLEYGDESRNPTIIQGDTSAGVVYLKEGSAATTTLTSPAVFVHRLQFEYLGMRHTKESVWFSLEVARAGDGAGNQPLTRTVQSAVTTRQ